MIMDDQQISQRHSIFEQNAPNQPGVEVIDLSLQADTCCNVYVANLPPSADAPAIRALFETAGKVLHVKLLLDIASGVSRGIAFVMFENMDMARKACAAKNKVVLDGNVLQVRLAERSSLHSSVNSHVRSSVVYIRNVPGTITHDVVKRFCEEKFGPVVDVSPHPQSAELKGPSPFNMDFVVFKSVDDACRCVESVDGRATFPMPPNHPLTMAKMITDVAGEMRKSILLRRRSSDNQAQRRGSGPSPKLANSEQRRPSQGAGSAPSPTAVFSSQHVSHLPVNPQFQPFAQSHQLPQPFPTNLSQVNSPQPTIPGYSMGFSSTSGVPVYESPVYNTSSHNQSNFFDSSQSHRSSLDASMFQSQRGSVFILNNPQSGPSYSPLAQDGVGSGFAALHSMQPAPQAPTHQHQIFQPSMPHLMGQPMSIQSAVIPPQYQGHILPMHTQQMSMHSQQMPMQVQHVSQHSPLQTYVQPAQTQMHAPHMMFMPMPNQLGGH